MGEADPQSSGSPSFRMTLAGTPPTMVLAGAVDPAPLRAAGWALRGTLSGDPYGHSSRDRLTAATYVEADELLEDAAVDAVALDGDDRDLARLLPALRDSGLLLLLRALRSALAHRDTTAR